MQVKDATQSNLLQKNTHVAILEEKDKAKDDNHLYLGDEDDYGPQIPTNASSTASFSGPQHPASHSSPSLHQPQNGVGLGVGVQPEYGGPGNFGPNEGHGYGPGHSPYGQFQDPPQHQQQQYGSDPGTPGGPDAHPIDSMPELAFENLGSKLSGSGRTMSMSSQAPAGLSMVLNQSDTNPIIPTLRHPSQTAEGLAGSAYRKQVAAQRQKLQQQDAQAYHDIGSYPHQSSHLQQLPPPSSDPDPSGSTWVLQAPCLPDRTITCLIGHPEHPSTALRSENKPSEEDEPCH